MKVLIIDDEEDIRQIASLSLSLLGGSVVIEASSGKEGIAKAAKTQPDVILLDIMMPDLDGPTTLAKLRKNPATKNIPVIFLTAKIMQAEEERLKQLGVVGIINKPFNPTILANQIKALLE